MPTIIVMIVSAVAIIMIASCPGGGGGAPELASIQADDQAAPVTSRPTTCYTFLVHRAGRVRSGPGTDYREVGQVEEGDSVALIKEETVPDADGRVWRHSCSGEDRWVASTLLTKNPSSVPPATGARLPAHPLDMMATVFVGGHSRSYIKRRLDRVMRLYGLPITEEDYNRAGSVLVSLRKQNGVPEMEIVDCMIEGYTPGTPFDYPTAAAMCATLMR